jgi:hypothetical protein
MKRKTAKLAAALFFISPLLSACGGGSPGSGNFTALFYSRTHSAADIAAEFGSPNVAAGSRGGDDGALTIAVDVYAGSGTDDADRVYVQRLEYARLGIWDTRRDDFDYRYADLENNRVSRAPSTADGVANAIYDVEADAVYQKEGVYFNIFPDGTFTADFNAGTISGTLSVNGDFAQDDFGGDMIDGNPVESNDDLTLIFSGDINAVADSRGRGIKGEVEISVATGFFSGLDNGDDGNFNGAFYDAEPEKSAEAPAEIAGEFDAGDGDHKLRGGFLGKKR